MKTVNVPSRLSKLENNPEHWALEQQGMCQTPRTSEEVILMFYDVQKIFKLDKPP